MTTRHTFLVLLLVAASTLAMAQEREAAPPTPPPAPAAGQSPAGTPPANKVDRAAAYYHYLLGHMYEEQAAMTGRMEAANNAIEEYRQALAADPNSAYLGSALAELYARTGRIKDAVQEAQESIQNDPKNLNARRLLGRIYLRSLGEMQNPNPQGKDLLRLAIEQYEQIVALDPKSVEDHLLLGRLYVSAKDFAKAEGEFRAALQLQPASEEAITLLAYLYNDMGDTARALAVLEAVPEHDRTAKIESALGFTYQQKKDYKSAIAAYRKAVEADKDNLEALRGLAESLLEDDQVDAALQLYESLRDAEPQDVESLLRIADIYRRDGKFEQALDVLKHAAGMSRDNVEVRFETANVYEAMGRYDNAIQVLNDLIQRTGPSAGDGSANDRSNRSIFLEHLGSVYREENKTKEAVDAFRRMLPLGDDAAIRAYREIVETYNEARQWQEASLTLHEAVKDYPNDRRLQLDLAGDDADHGRPDEAIARVKALLNGAPENDREIWVTLTQIDLRQKRWDEAEEAVSKVQEISSKPEEREFAGYLEGSVYEREKKYDKAEEAFRKVLAEFPRDAAVLNYLGYMLADRGVRLDEALGYLRRALVLEPSNGAYLDSLGWVYFKMGNYQLAEENLRKALELQHRPDHP